MSLELFSIILLLAIFAVGTVLPINLGLMSYVAAFLFGTIGVGLTVDEIFGGFPGDLFILLAGVTFLFAIAQSNGTVDMLLGWGVRLVGGNVGLVPWIMFALTALFTSIGALSPAAVAIVAPIGLRFAARYEISPLIMGILIIQGATAGAYSPINFFGLIVNDLLGSEGITPSPGLLYVNSLVFNALVAAMVFFALGGLSLLRRQVPVSEAQPSPATASPATASPATASAGVASGPVPGGSPSSEGGEPIRDTEEVGGEMTPFKLITLVGLALLAVLALGFDVDVGFAALTVALGLILIRPSEQAEALGRIPWSSIILITGIVTYVAVLEESGTFVYMQGLIEAVGSPALATLAASYVGGVISAFASTTGILGAIIPLAAPILENPAVSPIGVVTAIALSSAIVDASPFSTNGALVLSNAQNVDERRFFKQLLLWGVIVTTLGPLLAWLAFVVIGIP